MSDEATADLLGAAETWAPERVLRRLRTIALLVAAAAGLGCAVGAIVSPVELLRGYLVAFVYWLALTLGSMAIAMVGQLSAGGWSVVLRRTMEAAARTSGPMAVLFLPILLGVRHLYPWAHEGGVHPSVGSKAVYLGVPFFTVRSIVYLALWTGTAHLLSRLSWAQDRGGDPGITRRLGKVSAAGLVVYFVTMTLASVDWMMSLDPEWWSTIYGIYVIGGQAVSAMAFGVIAALALESRGAPIRARHFHDAGKMLLAFVMLWAYFAISQLIVIWSGNLPEDIPFYRARLGGGYRWVSLGLVILHFAVPFLLLLSRDLKRNARLLAGVAGLLLVMRWVDVYWLVAPAWSPSGVSVHWLDAAAFVAVGGVWLAAFFWQLGARPLLPIGDANLEEAIRHG